MEKLLAEWGLSPEMFNMLLDWAIRIVGVIVILFVAAMVAKWLQGKIRNRLENSKFDKTLARVIAVTVRWVVMILAFIGCLGIFGIQTTSFAAILGAAALAIGLAFKGTLANVAAGAMLLIFRPYKVDDWVTVDGVSGSVYEVGLFTTTIDHPDGRRFIVPNSNAFGKTIQNNSTLPERQVRVNVGVGYDADIDVTRKTLVDACRNLGGVIDTPTAFLSELGGSSVNWQVRVPCKTEDYWELFEEVVKAVKEALDTAGIDMPYPHMVVEQKTVTANEPQAVPAE